MTEHRTLKYSILDLFGFLTIPSLCPYFQLTHSLTGMTTSRVWHERLWADTETDQRWDMETGLPADVWSAPVATSTDRRWMDDDHRRHEWNGL